MSEAATDNIGPFEQDVSNLYGSIPDSPADRLRLSRRLRGYTSGSKFARQVDMNIWTYLRYERGVQQITPAIDAIFTRELRLEPGMILYGYPARNDLSTERQVPIVGILRGSTGRIDTTMPQGLTSTIPAYIPDDLVSIIIDDDAMYPAYRAGDRVFFRALGGDGFTVNRVHGKECVVELENGEQMVRQVFVQENGRCTLGSYAAATTVMNARVVAAEPIEIVFRAMRR